MAGNGSTRVTAEAMAAAIQNFETRNSEFQNAYLRISNVVRELGVNYKSEAATVFYNKFNDLYSNLSKTENEMEAAIKELKDVKEVYDALTAAQKAIVDALENTFNALGNIFG